MSIVKIETNEDVLYNLKYIKSTIDKMTTGNFSQHRNRISFSLQKLDKCRSKE